MIAGNKDNVIRKGRLKAKNIVLLLVIVLLIAGFSCPAIANESVNAVIPVTVNGKGHIQVTPIEGAPKVEPEILEINRKGEIVIPVVGSGIFKYKVSVVKDDPKIIYDETVYLVQIYADDSYDRPVQAVLINKINDKKKLDAIEFNNSSKNEELRPAYGDPPIRKVVEGDPKNSATFKFIFKATKNDAGYDVGKMPMPSGSKNGVKEKVVVGGGEYEFGEIKFIKAGTYIYTAYEKKCEDKAYSTDRKRFTVTYTVTKEGKGLTAIRKIVDANGKQYNAIKFVNKYDPDKPFIINTGDPRNVLFWICVLSLSFVILAAMLKKLKRKKTNIL